MSENINIEANETVDLPEAGSEKYTLDYVLEQIENLQKQITENSNHSLHRLSDAIRPLCDTDTESGEDENRTESVACVCEIFRYREVTLQKLLAFYEKMYDDLKPKAPEPVDPQLKVYIDLLNLDRALLAPEFRRRIQIEMIEYTTKLKENTLTVNQND